MTRYFLFEFISMTEFKNVKNWELKIENIKADGVIFAILTNSDEEITEVIKLLENTKNVELCLFIILKNIKR